jgi:tetratricopeptide (TPR) repeat protein
MSYFASAEDAKALDQPKGVHIITGIRDEQPNSLSWMIDTAADKPFELRASSHAEKTRFLESMQKAAEAQRQRATIVSPIKSGGSNDLPPAAVRKLNAALELGSNGYIEQAVSELVALAELHKGNAEVLYHLGSCRLVEGREQMAIDILTEALRLIGTTNVDLYCDAMNNIGLAHFILGDFIAARSCLKNALQHRPKDPDALSNLASVYLESEDYAAAEALLKETMKSSLPGVNAMLNWADMLIGTERTPAAVESLYRLVSIHPTCHLAHFKLGELYEKEGTLSKAVAAYATAYSLQDHRSKYASSLNRVRLLAAEGSSVAHHTKQAPTGADAAESGGVRGSIANRRVSFHNT